MQRLRIEPLEVLHSPTQGSLALPDVIEKIRDFVHAKPEYCYRIIIGSDSQKRGKRTEFVTALIVHRIGGGGIYFWKRYGQERPYALRERIYEEAVASLNFANEFINFMKCAPDLLQLDLEIHVDIGERGKTRDMIAEVVAMVQSNGYQVKTKPDAYGASSIADRYT